MFSEKKMELWFPPLDKVCCTGNSHILGITHKCGLFIDICYPMNLNQLEIYCITCVTKLMARVKIMNLKKK